MTLDKKTLKVLYGVTFVVFLPLLLVCWAYTVQGINLPVVASAQWGIAIASAGVALVLAGTIAIILYGGGLPMNPFPPARFVHRGVYRLMSHPIYLGFFLACAGVSLALRSASGLWLISPVVALGCAALVEGFEKQDMASRWGTQLPKPLLHLPPDLDSRPSTADRLSVYILVLLPWLVLYEAIIAIGTPPDAVVAHFRFEEQLPVIEWTEAFYAGTYVLVVIAPIFGGTSRILREFSIAGLLGTSTIILCFVALPLIAPPRNFAPSGYLGALLQWERRYDGASAAFPSFHVFWAILAARSFARTYPASRNLWYLLAVFIAVSCVTTGMHPVIDVAAGAIVAWVCVQYKTAWEWVRSGTERLANSWKEWRFGAVRLINHGAYPGIGTFLGLLLIGILTGSGAIGYMLVIAFSSLVAAALWAQFVEGSTALLRPYGYYGGVLGVFVGDILVYAMGGDAWLFLAAFATAGPIIQASGRLRCLIQGCCHGRPAPGFIGIRYTHPMSRVCRLAKLTDVPVHATPLYSILWNVVIGAILFRLWFLHAPQSLIAGLYLILNGLGRFVEEAYRGEPQTAVIGRLRLYQIIAIVSVIMGAVLTTASTPDAAITFKFDISIFAAAFAFGLVTWFALGVDFPESSHRFARLT